MSYERTDRVESAEGTQELPQLAEEARLHFPAGRPPAPAANGAAKGAVGADPESATAPKTAPRDTPKDTPDAKKTPERPPKQVAEAKLKMRERLAALEDDADIGVEKNQIVTRDGKPDLAFNGMLIASAAPEHTVEDHWWEYRIYRTQGGKHVFSKVDRTIYEGEDDAYTAEVFDPSPSSVPSQLLRSARELARSKPVTWQEAAAAFYGYGPIAKALYRKLDDSFEEQIE